MPEPKNISILGLGWLGSALAHHFHEQGHVINGSVSSLEKLSRSGQLPFSVSRLSVEKNDIIGDWEAFLFETEVLVITIPPRRTDDVETSYPQKIAQIIQGSPPDLRVIFTSTTGVYGNSGETVDEKTPTEPDKASGRAVRKAEEKLTAHFGENLTILRLAGLIGPDRHPGRFLASKRALRNGLASVNLVHQADCVGMINEVVHQNCWGEILNVCAGQHPIRKDYYQHASKALGLDPPVFKESDEASFKIVDNTLSRVKLGYTYQYDDPTDIFSSKHPGKVSIVGAGPGDKKLLTLKAAEAIRSADVILYDNLVSDEILQLAQTSELHYVGRKYADHSCQKERQSNINEQLHHHYKQGKQVVRLKSGDPYIYGRAAEEARYLAAQNIPFEVVPGISAALAAANLFNIPVTERNKSNALMICTAHTADYSFDQLNGIAALLKAGNALAIYMGLKSLDKLIPKLIEVCHDDLIPISAISNVSRDKECLITSTLKDIREDISRETLSMPVVFLVGAKPIKS